MSPDESTPLPRTRRQAAPRREMYRRPQSRDITDSFAALLWRQMASRNRHYRSNADDRLSDISGALEESLGLSLHVLARLLGLDLVRHQVADMLGNDLE